MTDGLVAPAVARRRLGSKLRELRGLSGYPLSSVAEALEFSTAKLSRLEAGQVSPKTRDVRDLLELYGVTSELRQKIMRWTEEAKHDGWWQPLPPAEYRVDLDLYISLEAEAKSISQFSGAVVPGLLQRPAYAEALLADVYRSAPREALAKLVKIRLGRQAVLMPDRSDAPPLELHVVLDEGALHRRPRTEEDPTRSLVILRDQLTHLATAADWPNVTLQILRFQDGFTEAAGVMTIFRPRETSDWTVVNVEGAGHHPFYSEKESIETFEHVWNEMISSARGESDSKRLIQARIDDLAAAIPPTGAGTPSPP